MSILGALLLGGWLLADVDPLPVPVPVPETPTGHERGGHGRRYPFVDVDTYLWIAGYKGKFERERNEAGNDFHPQKSDFGLDFPAPAFSYRITAALNDSIALELDHAIVYRGGDGRLRRGFIFDGVSYNAGTPVRTRVQAEAAMLQLEWSYYSVEPVRAGFLAGVGMFEERFRIKSLNTKVESAEAVDAIGPFVGLSLGFDLSDLVSIESRMRFLGYVLPDTRFGVWDFEALLHVRPVERFSLHVGFRHLSVDNHQEDHDGNLVGDFMVPAFLMGLGFRF